MAELGALAGAPAAAGTLPGARGGLRELDLAAVAACGAALRGLEGGARSLEEAARQVAGQLHGAFADAGRSSSVLTRVFVTARAGELDEALRVRLPACPDDAACLVLLATQGDEPDWNDRHRSRSHQVLPLTGPDEHPLDAMPMVKALFEQFGVSTDLAGRYGCAGGALGFGVFHVEDALGSPLVPAQGFVQEHGVRSVVGFGCALADGRVVAVLQFTRVPLPARRAELFRALAVSLHLALLPLSGAPLFEGGAPALPGPVLDLALAERRGLEQLVAVLGESLQSQAAELRAEALLVGELQRLGGELAAELDPEALMALAVRSAVRTTGATVGLCLYDQEDGDGETRQARHLFGLAPDAPVLRALQELAGLAPLGGRVVRAEALDLTGIGSCLAAPVVSRCGRVLGALLLAHPAPVGFDARAEQLLVGIAGHTALALDNARLFARQRDAATELQRNLLPTGLPDRPGLSFDARYLPGGSGSEAAVGGDWYDVIGGAGDRTAVVIGDVMGRGLRAAAAMGQLRTSLRALLLAGHGPSEALQRLDDLLQDLPDERIATCAIGLYDPADRTLELVSAGHLPLVLHLPGRPPALVGGAPAGPLGALGEQPVPTRVGFPPGSSLLLFTDGLVERRAESIDAGLERLCAGVAAQGPRLDLDRLLQAVQCGVQDDDTALLLVHADGPAAW